MTLFETYFKLGLAHITDAGGYDHMLFLLITCTGYTLLQWKRLALLATAFTAGHSLSMALAVFGLLNMPSEITEFLIPLTILITATGKLVAKQQGTARHIEWPIVALFGIVHGLGFSGYLKMLLGSTSMAMPLLAFNLGLEAGQLIIIITVALLFFIASAALKDKIRLLQKGIALFTALISLFLLYQNKFW